MTACRPVDGQTDEASSTSHSTLPHLPFDLVSDILCRLSVKHLLQFCCVCKSWNSLISLDSNFARKQLSLSTTNKDRHHLILYSTQSSHELLLGYSQISSFFHPRSIVPVTQLRQPLLTEALTHGVNADQVSTCDGILCFGTTESSALLCNPCTGKFKISPPLKKPSCFHHVYTLVYDPITGNYKIFAIVTHNYNKKEVYIHTLGTDYWTSIQDFPCPNNIDKPGTSVNHTINWLTNWFTCDTSLLPVKVIVSLDFDKNSYQILSPPFYDDSLTLGALRGCLSIFSSRDMFFNIWIMKEYGNENSWTKLFSFPQVEECGFYCYIKALYISEDDQVLVELLKGEFGLVVYDSKNNFFNIVKMQNNFHHLRVEPYVYVESLISPF